MFTPLSQGREDQHDIVHETRSPISPNKQNTPVSRASKIARRRRKRAISQTAALEEERDRHWLLRPPRKKLESWLDSWWKRWAVLVLTPSAIVWIWCAIPFPVSDPYKNQPPWRDPVVFSSNDTRPGDDPILPVDANFWFFLFFYYGSYLAVALMFITSLFSLYRLNWWPSTLGFRTSYFGFWTSSIGIGALLHHLDLFGIRNRRAGKVPNGDGVGDDWERKTFWVFLAFGTMGMPAMACFIKLRATRRNSYRHSLSQLQQTFIPVRALGTRIPKSYLRFIWFMLCIGVALLAGIAGQAYISLYLRTLPHNSAESIVWVWTWVGTSTLLGSVTSWALDQKVRSRALKFVFQLYFQLCYHVFYRTIFARLRSIDQFASIQAISSLYTIVFYPTLMSTLVYRIMQVTMSYDRSYDDHLDFVAQTLYVRNLSENVTMVAFLGWLTILHYGPNLDVYPFFEFDKHVDENPYTYQLTLLASIGIWFSELFSSFIARTICKYTYHIDVTNTGLDLLREVPDAVPACVYASIHVLMDTLLFLIKLNFR